MLKLLLVVILLGATSCKEIKDDRGRTCQESEMECEPFFFTCQCPEMK